MCVCIYTSACIVYTHSKIKANGNRHFKMHQCNALRLALVTLSVLFLDGVVGNSATCSRLGAVHRNSSACPYSTCACIHANLTASAESHATASMVRALEYYASECTRLFNEIGPDSLLSSLMKSLKFHMTETSSWSPALHRANEKFGVYLTHLRMTTISKLHKILVPSTLRRVDDVVLFARTHMGSGSSIARGSIVYGPCDELDDGKDAWGTEFFLYSDPKKERYVQSCGMDTQCGTKDDIYVPLR